MAPRCSVTFRSPTAPKCPGFRKAAFFGTAAGVQREPPPLHGSKALAAAGGSHRDFGRSGQHLHCREQLNGCALLLGRRWVPRPAELLRAREPLPSESVSAALQDPGSRLSLSFERCPYFPSLLCLKPWKHTMLL